MLHLKKYFLLCFTVLFTAQANAQLNVTPGVTPEELAQMITGNGVQIFNVHFTGSAQMAGLFYNDGNNNIGIDSGIVLTTGTIVGGRNSAGIIGDGVTPANMATADNGLQLPGDADIARELGVTIDDLHDACILEFDFIPIGDSVSFKYVFASEEYVPLYVCSFNDAFAFFITGPGIDQPENIALIPNSNIPVSIFNVNNVPGGTCPNNPSYYVDNSSNIYFTYDGHTKVLTAAYKVISCQTYHLKLVVSDAVDDQFDSGVFLQAKSLVSKSVRLSALTRFDNKGKPYVAEGCADGKLKIWKTFTSNDPANVILEYTGTAANGTDVQYMQAGVIIPAGQTETQIDIKPVIDNISEGIETLKIRAYYNCNLNDPVINDSIEIDVRDFEPMTVLPDSQIVCRNQQVQLLAQAGYASYRWDNNSSISNINIRNPIASPANGFNSYYCTATNGTCKARDSALVIRKSVFVEAAQKLTCRTSSDGSITMSAGPEWQRPVQFSFNNGAFSNDSVYTNLVKGNYILKMKDAAGCTDSISYFLDQQHPDPVITSITTTAATCSGLPDGGTTVTVTGGVAPFTYSVNNTDFVASDSFSLFRGNYTMYVIDSAGCNAAPKTFVIPFRNSLIINTINDTTICEGSSVTLTTEGESADHFIWQPSLALNSDTLQSPVASPVSTTKYIVLASKGICTGKDSVTITVNKAPVPNAGNDSAVCYNNNAQLYGSGGIKYEWQPALLLDNDSIANPVTDSLLTDTWFTLNVIDAKGCHSLITDSVKITVRAPARVSLGADTIVAVNQPLLLIARDVNNSGLSNFTWMPATGLTDPSAASTIAKITADSITYIVTASSPEGCSSSDTIFIRSYLGPQIYVPSAFTPNYDGLNDVLHFVAAGFRQVNYFSVYNRWGERVFFTSNQLTGWDGKYKNKEAVTGTYVWVAEGITYAGMKVVKRGTVTVIR